MQRLKTFLTVIGAITILVLAANSAVYAATGGKFILGQTNKANKISTLKRTTSGPALGLVTTSSSNAPLSTNGRGKVANLNADKLDGQDSSVLKTRSYVFRSSVSNASIFNIVLPLPVGSYLVSWTNFFSGLGTASIDCYVIEDNPGAPAHQVAVEAMNNTAGTFVPSMSGSGLATKQTGGSLTFHCIASGDTFDTPSDIPIQVVATPTTVISSTTLTASTP